MKWLVSNGGTLVGWRPVVHDQGFYHSLLFANNTLVRPSHRNRAKRFPCTQYPLDQCTLQTVTQEALKWRDLLVSQTRPREDCRFVPPQSDVSRLSGPWTRKSLVDETRCVGAWTRTSEPFCMSPESLSYLKGTTEGTSSVDYAYPTAVLHGAESLRPSSRRPLPLETRLVGPEGLLVGRRGCPTRHSPAVRCPRGVTTFFFGSLGPHVGWPTPQRFMCPEERSRWHSARDDKMYLLLSNGKSLSLWYLPAL